MKGGTMETYQIDLQLTEPVLGTVPKDREIYKNYVAGKMPISDDELADELETIDEVEEKGWTGFHMRDGSPVVMDYVIKGFLKDACSMLRRVSGTKSSKLTAYRKIIDGLVFASPREIRIHLPDGVVMGVSERPLRAQTAQGERVTLARSDTCPAGSRIGFTLTVLGGVSEALLCEWLEYGELRGLGQWRNAGYGTFTCEMRKL